MGGHEIPATGPDVNGTAPSKALAVGRGAARVKPAGRATLASALAPASATGLAALGVFRSLAGTRVGPTGPELFRTGMRAAASSRVELSPKSGWTVRWTERNATKSPTATAMTASGQRRNRYDTSVWGRLGGLAVGGRLGGGGAGGFDRDGGS